MFWGLLYGTLVGFGIAAIVYWALKNKFGDSKKSVESSHVSIITDKIEKVFKIVVAEGYFSEIIDYKHKDTQLWGLISSTKKSLIMARAKVLVGFDTSKIKFEIDTKSKTIRFETVPSPEILAIEPDYKFYDIENGWFNKFNDDDYTVLLQNAKNEIASRTFEGDLILTANKQMTLVLNSISDANGFKLLLPSKTKEVGAG